jgi:hypothetical protein
MLVELTAAGHDVLSRVRQSREKRLKDTLALLAPAQASALLTLLRTYLEAFRQQYDEPTGEEPTHQGIHRW